MTASRHVQRQRRIPWVRSAAQSVLAGFLAVILLAGAVASASPSVHGWLHSSVSGAHACLVCSICKGQILSHDVTTFHAVFGSVLIFSAPLPERIVLAQSDSRLAPSRAPPLCKPHPSGLKVGGGV